MELRRHELVRLTPDGWRRASSTQTDPQALRCVAHWQAHDLPLVVATQAATFAEAPISLGLPAPTAWGRGRHAIRVAAAHLRRGRDAFPTLWDCGHPVGAALPDARVYGSVGWQHLTGLAYVREESDLDLLLPAVDAANADAIVALLSLRGDVTPRLDGEICFVDGSNVAWREWQAWRAGRARTIVVKRVRGATLEHDDGWVPAGATMAAAT